MRRQPETTLDPADRNRIVRHRQRLEVLELLDQSVPAGEIARRTGLSAPGVHKIAERYREGGWKAVFEIAPGRGRRPGGTGAMRPTVAEEDAASAPFPANPTMEDVAREAGVHRATISQALRGSPKVAEATAERIRRVAEKMGYRPHPYVSTLMRQVRKRRHHPISAELAWIYHGRRPLVEDWATPWGGRRRFFEGAQARAEALGFRLEPYWINEPGLSHERLRAILQARGVHGLLLDIPSVSEREVEFDFSGFSSVSLYPLAGLACHQVVHDSYRMVLEVCEILWRKGYRRIGFIVNRWVMSNVLHREEAAYLLFMDQAAPGVELPLGRHEEQADLLRQAYFGAGKPPKRPPPPAGAFYKGVDWNALLEPLIERGRQDSDYRPDEDIQVLCLGVWLERARPDVVLVNDGRTLDYFARLGHRVPEDVSVVHLNRGPDVADWSGWRVPEEEIGAHAAELLVESVQTAPGKTLARAARTVFPGQFVEGRTAPGRPDPDPPLAEEQLSFLQSGTHSPRAR